MAVALFECWNIGIANGGCFFINSSGFTIRNFCFRECFAPNAQVFPLKVQAFPISKNAAHLSTVRLVPRRAVIEHFIYIGAAFLMLCIQISFHLILLWTAGMVQYRWSEALPHYFGHCDGSM
jgi:hypothetical protein